MKYIMALDSGTSSVRCILFDREGKTAALSQREITQHYPKPGWVEHDAEEIWQAQLSAARQAMKKLGISWRELAAIGITNQRETTILWDRKTGQAIGPAIVWQCRRTADMTEHLRAEHPESAELFRKKTGLLLDPYFSGTKIRWILDHTEGARERAERGEL